MHTHNLDIIVGTRPNFIKAAALFAIANQFTDLNLRLIHTGQHGNASMSDIFFSELGLPTPACRLDVTNTSHATQTADIMKGYERWIDKNIPDMCVVVGDVNSTLACALVAAKSNIPIAHVEAGLRSFDRKMPEEINRIATDALSSLLFATEPSAVENLKNEGQKCIHHVGNVMIDTLFRMKKQAKQIDILHRFKLIPNGYAYATLHRPSNIENKKTLNEIINQIIWLSSVIPVVFPVHPRTKRQLMNFELYSDLINTKNCVLMEPIGYLESIATLMRSRIVVTDSGGLQEETTALGIPCLTLRGNTERPITVTHGTNLIIGNDWELFRNTTRQIVDGLYLHRTPSIPLWDGKSGKKILQICAEYLRTCNRASQKTTATLL